MADARLRIAKADIVRAFDERESPVLTTGDIEAVVQEKRHFWRLRETMTTDEFVDFLLRNTKLRKVALDFPHRKVSRYTWGVVSFNELLMAIDKKCYLSHYTAVAFHGLTEQVPKAVYVNREQPPKPHPSGDMTQESIDRAFRAPTRQSSNFITYEDRKIYLLSGKQTGNLGVIETKDPDRVPVRVTGVERTLIDIAVRPEYAGGPFEVLAAYKAAHGKASVNKLAATLKQLDYLYPYHQVIGFYLERAGVYRQSAVELLRAFEFRYDFYLMHQIKDKAYSEKWRLFYPKGF